MYSNSTTERNYLLPIQYSYSHHLVAMALARLAIISLSCVLFLLFYSSTCVAIPVPPGTNVGNRQTWKPHTPAPGTGHTTPPGKGLSTRAPAEDNTTPAPGTGNTKLPTVVTLRMSKHLYTGRTRYCSRNKRRTQRIRKSRWFGA